MDFLKLIRSFGDLLFEVLSWLIYYPRTLWMVFRHPLQMIDYSNHEQTDRDEDQYSDTLAPPLLLLLTIVLLHVLEVGLGTWQEIHTRNAAVGAIINSDENIVLLRSFLFGLLPLFAALNYVRKRSLPLERSNLKAPVYGQCYLAGAYALLISLATWTGKSSAFQAFPLGIVLVLLATAWYLSVQTLQNRRALGLGWLHALGSALWVYLEAFVYLIVIALLLAGGPGS